MNKKYIIFDIDGVLANCEQRLHHIEGENKNWDAFFEDCDKDEPIWSNLKLLQLLLYQQYEIEQMVKSEITPNTAMIEVVLLTGRNEAIRDKTIKWFADICDMNILPVKLYMRPNDDYRHDYTIKEEYGNYLGMENIICVFEDRDRVVKMWRDNGVQCHQTCEGSY
jgi:hypothetical protein